MDSEEKGCSGGGDHSSQDYYTEASRGFDIPPSEIEDWVDEAKNNGMNTPTYNGIICAIV